MTEGDMMAAALDADRPTKGLTFERGFWRGTNGAVWIASPSDGKRRQYGAPSSLWKNNGDSLHNLWRWSERNVLLGAIAANLRGDLPTLGPGSDAPAVDAAVLEMKRIAGAERAAEQGTHSHLVTELDDTGAHWLDAAEAGEYVGLPMVVQQAVVEAWRKLIDECGLQIIDVELTVVSEDTMTAGTLDRTAVTTKPLNFERRDGSAVHIPTGTKLVVDVKTGQLRTDSKGHPDYWAGYGAQIYCYATGVPALIDPEDSHHVEWGEPHGCSTEHALIVHLDVARALDTGVCTATLVYVDLVEAAVLIETIDQVKYARKRKLFSRTHDGPRVVVDVELTDETGAVDNAVVAQWLKRRVSRIGNDPTARPILVRHWPKGIPPVTETVAPEHVDVIVDLLDRVEAAAGLPFGPPDPRAPRAGHQSGQHVRATTQEAGTQT